jgi:hypothetical protein
VAQLVLQKLKIEGKMKSTCHLARRENAPREYEMKIEFERSNFVLWENKRLDAWRVTVKQNCLAYNLLSNLLAITAP